MVFKLPLVVEHAILLLHVLSVKSNLTLKLYWLFIKDLVVLVILVELVVIVVWVVIILLEILMILLKNHIYVYYTMLHGLLIPLRIILAHITHHGIHHRDIPMNIMCLLYTHIAVNDIICVHGVHIVKIHLIIQKIITTVIHIIYL